MNIKTLLFVIILVSLACSTIVFEDDFSGDLSGWEEYAGGYLANSDYPPKSSGGVIIVSGQMQLKGNQVVGLTGVHDYENIGDFLLEFDLTIKPFGYGQGNIFFRIKDNSYHAFSIEKYNADGKVTDTPTRLRVFKNNSEPALETVSKEFPVNQAIRISMQVIDTKLDVYMDNALLLTCSSGNIKPTGRIAFQSYKAEWYIDNVILSVPDDQVVSLYKPLAVNALKPQAIRFIPGIFSDRMSLISDIETAETIIFDLNGRAHINTSAYCQSFSNAKKLYCIFPQRTQAE